MFDTQRDYEQKTPYTHVATRQAWINAPEATFVTQRGLLNGAEQRIGLQTDTPVPGDNLIVLRTRLGMNGSGTLQFEEFMRRIGGAPAPFEGVKSGDLRSGEDTLGTYFWAEKTFGTDLTCIFGIRRLKSSMRQLPGDALSMDIMLRNCVRGFAEEALEPMLDANISVEMSAGSGMGSTRMLSPLAAPGN